VIASGAQADGTTGLGRLVITQPNPTSVAIAEDVAGSPFGGLKFEFGVVRR